MRFGAHVALTDQEPSPVRKSGTSTTTKKRKKTVPKSYSRRLIREANKHIQLVGSWSPGASKYRVWFPNWDHTSPLLKAMAYGMAIPETRRVAFSLKLSEQVIVRGLKSKLGFAGFMQDRIARYLRKALPKTHPAIDFVVVVEGWHRWEPLHVQGVIDLPTPDLSDLLSEGEHNLAIEKALQGAGGQFDGKSRGTQLDTRQAYECAGWFEYLGKRRMVTRKTLGQMRKELSIPNPRNAEGLVAATSGLKRAGKRWFDEARKSGDYVLRKNPFTSRR
jgi:hypothetical protein